MQNTPFPFTFSIQPQLQQSFSLAMENWATRETCRMEHEPLHPPISQKIHWQPDLSFRYFNHTTPIMENIRALVTRRWQSPILPEVQGIAVAKPSPPAFIGAPQENSEVSILKDLALTAVLKTAAAPFERVKLLMQNQNEMIKSGRLPKRYNGIFDCFATTIRNEGIFSLWRGNIAIATGFVFSQAISVAMDRYANSCEDIEWTHTGWQVATFLASVVNQFLVYPLFYAGTRMTNDVKTSSNFGERQFNGMVDVYRKTLKSDGIAGVYRGFNVTIAELGIMKAASAFLNPWRRFLLLHFQKTVLAGAVIDIGLRSCLDMAYYPLDTVCRRMMMTTGAVKYKNSLHAIAYIFTTEGVKSFYNGAQAEIILIAVYQVYVLLMMYLRDVLSAAMEKPGDGTQTLTIRWKKTGDK